MPLSSATLTAVNVTTGAKTLLKEWLGDYFDGAAHSVGGVSVTFPDLTTDPLGIVFDQDIADQPETGSETTRQLRIIIVPGKTRQDWTDEAPVSGQTHRRWVFDEVNLQCWMTARAPTWPEGNMIVNQMADLLHAVLKNPAIAFPLAEKGVRHLRPRHAIPIQTERAPMRLLMCPAQLFYSVDWT